MKCAVIFDNLGPYHLARLQAAARVCDVLAIQVYAQSAEYPWSSRNSQAVERENQTTKGDDGQGEMRMVTLLESVTNQGDSRRDLATRLNWALDDFEPEVVFTPGWSSPAAFGALQWCGRQNVPVVCMSESTASDQKRSAWREAVKRRIVGLCSAALVGGSPHARYMVALSMPRERVFLGYNAVANGYFAQGANQARSAECETRNKYGLPESYFLASARFIEKKNLPGLIEAYAHYLKLAGAGDQEDPTPRPSFRDQGGEVLGDRRSSSPQSTFNSPLSTAPWSLVLLGDGLLRPELEIRISELGIWDSVHLPGFKQYADLPAYYGLARAFVHASTTEQWGLVVNEAMASGLPILVSYRCGCAADLLQDGLNGYTFDPHDVRGLASLMFRLSSGQVDCARMGRASQAIIEAWGPERFACGFKQAADCAVEVGPKAAGALDLLLLNALVRR